MTFLFVKMLKKSEPISSNRKCTTFFSISRFEIIQWIIVFLETLYFFKNKFHHYSVPRGLTLTVCAENVNINLDKELCNILRPINLNS